MIKLDYYSQIDSLTFKIETEDAYKDFWSDKDKLDNNEYSEISPYFNKSTKKFIGKFKDAASVKRGLTG